MNIKLCIFSCCKEDCNYSWMKIKDRINAEEVFQSKTIWSSLPMEIKEKILYFKTQNKLFDNRCEFCQKNFCDTHNSTFTRYFCDEYIITCQDCYTNKK